MTYSRPRAGLTAVCACLLCLFCLASSGCGLIIINGEGTDITSAPFSSSPPEATTVIPGTTDTPLTTDTPVTAVFPDRIGDAEARVESLLYLDLSEYDLMVTSSSDAPATLNQDESSPLYASFALRNAMICEKYGCRLFFMRSPTETLRAELDAAIKSDSYYSDILMLPSNAAGSFAVSGLLRNLRSLPFYNISASGNDGAGLYNISNYFDLSPAADDIEGIYALYFNRTLAGTEGTKTLYRAALDGSFTFEFMLTYMTDSYSSPDGTFALSSCGADDAYDFLGDIVLVRSGIDFVSNELGARPTLVGVGDTFAAVYAAADALISSLTRNTFYRPNTAAVSTDTGSTAEGTSAADTAPADTAAEGTVAEGTAAVTAAESSTAPGDNPTDSSPDPDSPFGIFASGGAAFRFGTLGEIRELYDDATEWGLLPLPYAEATGGRDAVYTVARASVPVIAVTANNVRTEPTGLVLTALGAASGEWMRDQYAAICIERYLRDNNSCLTLHMILNGVIYRDFAYLYGDAVTGLADATYGAARAAVRDGGTLADRITPLITAVNKRLKGLF